MALLFPDNTVLINFAYCGEMALLKTIVGAKGAWVASVEAECNQKADELQLPELRTARQIFGKPLRPETPAEHIQVRIHRDHFSSPGDGPKKHLGNQRPLRSWSAATSAPRSSSPTTAKSAFEPPPA